MRWDQLYGWYWHESHSLVFGQTRDNSTAYPSLCLGSARQQLIVFGGSYRCVNIHIILYSTYHQNSPSSSAQQQPLVVMWWNSSPRAQTTVWHPCCHQSCLELPSSSISDRCYDVRESRKRLSTALQKRLDTDEGAPNIFFQRSSIGRLILFVFWLAKRSVLNFCLN